MVDIRPEEDFSGLGEEVGVLDVKTLISALKKIPTDNVSLHVEGGKLDVMSSSLNFHLVTCDTEYVSTHKKKEYFDKFLGFVQQQKVAEFTITEEFVKLLSNAYNIISSETTYFNIGNNKSQVVIGESSENEATIPVNALTTDSAPFTVAVPTKTLLYSTGMQLEEKLIFSGEDSLVSIVGSSLTYIISPVTV